MKELDLSKRIGGLIAKHIQGTISDQEKIELDNWLQESEDNQKIFEAVTDPASVTEQLQIAGSLQKSWSHIPAQEQEKPGSAKKIVFFGLYKSVAAACIILACTAIWFYWLHNKAGNPASQEQQLSYLADIPGASKKAVLTLSDGKQLELKEKRSEMAQEKGADISINNSGLISYQSNSQQVTLPVYNSISVPRGGVFSLLLEDGTKVWLNNQTVIRFPIVFDHLAERRIFLEGEAYFEVAKDKQKPFIVECSNGQEIRVLGTRFNVRAFKDETSSTTSLVEGSVQLSLNKRAKETVAAVVMKPGDQATCMTTDGNKIALRHQADMEAALSWKNGLFHFDDNTDFEDVMKQVSRWYDVDIIYKGAIPKGAFSGDLYRSLSLNDLLTNLEKTVDVKFERKNKTLTIY